MALVRSDAQIAAFLDDAELATVAQQARQELSKLLPGLRSYASSALRRSVLVVCGSRTETTKDKIFIRPPLALGLPGARRHNLARCGERDGESGQLVCEACSAIENVLVGLRHEISHHAYGSFEPEDFGEFGYGSLLSLDLNQVTASLVLVLEDMRIDRNSVSDDPFGAGAQVSTLGVLARHAIEEIKNEPPCGDDQEANLKIKNDLASLVTMGLLSVYVGADVVDFFPPEVQAVLDDDVVWSLVGEDFEKAQIPQLALALHKRLAQLGVLSPPPEPKQQENEPEQQETAEPSLPEDSSEESGQAGDEPGDQEESTDGESDDVQPGGGSESGEGSECGDEEDGSEAGGDPEPGAGEEGADGGGERGDDSRSESSEVEDVAGDDPQGDSEDSGGESGGSSGAGESEAGENESSSDDAGDTESSSDDAGQGSSGSGGNPGGDNAGAGSSDGDGSGDDAGDVSDSGTGDGSSDNPLAVGEGSGADSWGDEQVAPEPGESEPGEIDDGFDDDAASAALASGNPYGPGHSHDPEQPLAGASEFSPGGQGSSGASVDASQIERMDLDSELDELFTGIEEQINNARADVESLEGLGKANIYHLPRGETGPLGGLVARERTFEPATDHELGLLVGRARRVFSDNQAIKRTRGQRRGRVDTGLLGKRAWNHDDGRVFGSRVLPTAPDYSVLVGMDNSGSTVSDARWRRLRQCVDAIAQMCHRTGVESSVWAHTQGYAWWQGDDELTLELYEVKNFDERWSPRVAERLSGLDIGDSNIDGSTLRFYRRQLQARRTERKVLLYFTDGKIPGVGGDAEERKMREEVETCRQLGITLLGVGVDTRSPEGFGIPTVSFNSVAEMGDVLEFLGREFGI